MSIEAELIARYGDSILDTPRQTYVPPRRAKDGHLLVSTPKPCQRKKLVGEIRGSKHRAYAPKDAGNYTFSNALPAFCKHVATVIGEVPRKDIGRLYPKRQRRTEFLNPFTVGQKAYRGEVSVTVQDVRGRSCIISWEMLGKRMTQAIHYTQLRPG